MTIANRIVGHGEEAPESLRANPANWRVHPKAQADSLMATLSEVGWVQDVVVNRRTGHVIDGHLRIELAISRHEPTIPVVYVDLSEDEERLVLATFDPIGAMAIADKGKLEELLRSISVGNAGMQAMLDDIAAQHKIDLAPDTREDHPEVISRADELQAKWQVQRGQVWLLGKHRVMCGDSTDADDVARLMQGEKAQGVFTSPPYAEQRKEQYGGVPIDKYVDWWETVQIEVKKLLLPDGSFFINIKPHCENGERVLYVFDLILAMRRRWGWRFVDEFCWERPGLPGYWNNRFRNEFEPIYHFSLGGHMVFNPTEVGRQSSDIPKGRGGLTKASGGNWTLADDIPVRDGIAQPGNVLRFARRDEEPLEHAAAFPVALPDFFIRAYSDEGDMWADPFLGSGTTLIAAEKLGRICYGMEIHPPYVSVVLERYLAFTGDMPRLADG